MRSFPKPARAARVSTRQRRHRPMFERLEPRLALSASASTTPAAPTIGQSLSAVVNNVTLGGIEVASVSSFAAAPAYLLLTQSGQQAPYGLVSYGVKTDTPTTQSFTTLALPAGDGSQIFQDSTIVAQAGSSKSTNGTTVTFATLSASTTNTITVAALAASAPGFTGTGFICINGASSVGQGGGGNGIFSYDVSSSTLPTAGSAGTFRGLKPVGTSGVGSSQPFKDIRVPGGTVVIESCAPTPGSTIVRTAVTLPAAGKPFSLPVIGGQYGFAKPQPGSPGSLIVGLPGGGTTIVKYTGITTDGLTFTGCTATVTGTIPMNASVNATADSPVTFTFTNNANQGVAAYAAIAGQLSDASGNLTYGYLVPQQTAGRNDFTKPLQFVSMASGSPPATVPTFQLFSAAAKPGATLSFKVRNSPGARMVSTRVVFGMGLPPVVPISSGKPAFPAMSNQSDLNNRVNFDFLEFTMRNAGPNDGTLFVNTTQVDQVGLPFAMNVSPVDSSGATDGVGLKIGRALLAASYADFVTTQFTGGDDQPISPAAEAAFKGLLTPYRLLNPSDSFTNPPAGFTASGGVKTFDGYFDAALATFFSNYTSGGFRLQRDGYNFVGTTRSGYQPAAYHYDTVTLAGASGTAATLTFPAVAVSQGTAPAPISLAAGVLVSGPGITGTAVVTGQPVVDANNVTTVSIAGTVAAGSPGTYTFTAPGEFTVLELQQADASWNPITGGQTYRIYAPYFAGGATAFPGGLPVGSGIGSVSLTSGGVGYSPNTVGQLTFTGGGGSNAAGFYVTDGTGTITAVGLTNPGSGYTSMPQIGFSGPSSAAAVVTASVMPAAPPWVAPGGPATAQSAGLMTFGCLGVFADGGEQAKAGQVSGTKATGGILSDIENTIVSAFNRGVANAVPVNQDVTTFWNTAANFYPKPHPTGANWSNVYAAFLHQPSVSIARPGSQVGLAYGFAYDDQGNNSTTLTSSFPNTVSVVLKPWQNKRYAPTPLTFTQQPEVVSGGLSAHLKGLAGLQYRWQLFQVASPDSGQWKAVGTPTTVTAGNRGYVHVSATAPAAGTYVLAVWAADTVANGGPAVPFGGQYDVSPRFTVTASELRVAAPLLRVAGVSAARQPIRWSTVAGR